MILVAFFKPVQVVQFYFPLFVKCQECQNPEVQIRKGARAVMNEYEGDQIDFKVAIWLNRVPI